MSGHSEHGFTNAVVRIFLHSNLALVLIVLASAIGLAALFLTPREEDPQIVVPLADIYVSFPGHGAEEVEKLVASPLEKLLCEIDGVEYVYSMSKADEAVVTVRFYVGEDRERSLVKLYKRIDEHIVIVPTGVTGWVVKPVEIDDVPVVTLTLAAAPQAARRADDYALRRVAEELVYRLAETRNVSRAYVVGGPPRVVSVYLDAERMAAHGVTPGAVQAAIAAADVRRTAGEFTRDDAVFEVVVGPAVTTVDELGELVMGVHDDLPVFLRDVARIEDGPAEMTSYVRHGWGPGRGFHAPAGAPGTVIGDEVEAAAGNDGAVSTPAVTIAIAKKKGTNAVWVAEDVLREAERLRADVVPDDMQLVVTRNYGLTADEKVNELVEALAVAIFIVVALLTLGLGWREALIVAVAVPVVFGLTLAVNYLCGYTINRVTLFALILSLGLLVDDPIVDVENIVRHFKLRGRATRAIVLEAVAEIRPPLITATLAVIVSFLPMFFISGMMGPYMRPMALNVPVTMIMSMVVAFTITPWLTYHVLRRHYAGGDEDDRLQTGPTGEEIYDLEALRRSPLYRAFYPLMAPLLHSRVAAWSFLGVMGLLMVAAMGLAAVRLVPLKMLPFDNKNELLLVVDMPEGTTLERTDAAVRELEQYVAGVAEVTDFTSYVGLASPMDFNGLVRHYYLRAGDNVAEMRVDLVGKKHRGYQSHALGLRMRDDLTAIARRHDANLKIVEMPPGPPVISTVTAEVRGRADQEYEELLAAAQTVRGRLEREPGVVDVDDTVEARQAQWVFVTDREKAALNGVTVEQIAGTLQLALGGATAGLVAQPSERNPLRIEVRLPRALRSSREDLAQIRIGGPGGGLVPLAELGTWREETVDQTIYHKNLTRVAYVFAETAGRTPAEVVLDVQADLVSSDRIRQITDEKTEGRMATEPSMYRVPSSYDLLVARTRDGIAQMDPIGSGLVGTSAKRGVESRTFLYNGGARFWTVPPGIAVDFAGEGEWQITLDVFRDLGLAFAAAMVGIYILLVAQMGSFVLPLIVMLAIPLTVIGIMPGFWLLNVVAGGQVGPYADPVLFTATGMIGMIALAGIVTRDSIILVDFIHISLARGRTLFEAIMESRVVRLRPILLTASAAMLGAAPITIDPIFSGLAWALIFGLGASTLFTLFVVPVAYWLLYQGPRDVRGGAGKS